MKLIEIKTKMGKDGIIQIPRVELEATGLKEGDEVCLVYVNNEIKIMLNQPFFLVFKTYNNHMFLPLTFCVERPFFSFVCLLSNS